MPAVSVIGQSGAGPPNFRVHAGQIAGHSDKARMPQSASDGLLAGRDGL